MNPSESDRGSANEGDLAIAGSTPKSPTKQWNEAISTIAEQSPAQSPVLVAESTPEAQRTDPDAALKMAIKAALDAGDLDRVKALVAVLESSGPTISDRDTTSENVVPIVRRRR